MKSESHKRLANRIEHTVFPQKTNCFNKIVAFRLEFNMIATFGSSSEKFIFLALGLFCSDDLQIKG